MSVNIINLAYLLASVLFILGIKGLTSPRTAVRGNTYSALAMLIAVVATLLDKNVLTFEYIIAGVAVGALIGAILAIRIEMTAMPQLVAVFNGFGGGASVLVAGAAFLEVMGATQGSDLLAKAGLAPAQDYQMLIATAISGIIGSVTFFGSFIAFAKLQRLFLEGAASFPGQRIVNLLVAIITVGLGIALVMQPQNVNLYWLMVAAAAILGLLLTVAIGGADMPVVIALLNSYSGLAAAATGFVLQNNVLIIAGSLVGASGVILTKIMCKAMNRSLVNVLFGGALGPGETTVSSDDVYEGKVKATSGEEVAMILDGARRVVIIPGYGMAVAQAQHAVRDLMNILEARGVQVEFAIHPVAGRMPGHMNVLLAEAEVPYDKLREMDSINPEMSQVDVAIVLGANDVVNPLAKTDPSSPIAGMPIIDVDQAHTVVVIKRSLSPGFAKIPNPLFAADNALMYFEDGKVAIQEIAQAVKEQ
ncbi:NAD(P)(+) transhydrogenase (Re/Si-specific) subunit beta [Desulfovibrio ferrophilus]|uniref:NAD(P) transhydrogenase subunit beta n=1 Tax=Desulfovibrio ferrophilus TaxID=241368 RepID=A0A2Z6AV23_9BACT|nr:NAD(P)(+) transhydrogenase (Re/Si-specific) subunit beta [Desulfovibrio ferrophilus]BBD07045.1 NAD(P)(+) transhydrogenase, beta component [Desulfovibrio ferrophilus]